MKSAWRLHETCSEGGVSEFSTKLALDSSALVFLWIWKVLLCVWFASRALTMWRLTANGFALSCLHVVPLVLCGTGQAPNELSLWGPSCRGGGRKQQGRPQQERNHKQHEEPYSSQNRAQGCPASPPCAPPLHTALPLLIQKDFSVLF